MNSLLNKKALTSQRCYITLVHTSYKKKLLAISDKVLIIKHSNIAEGQLVSALAGREHILNAYNIAVKERYRFFSFGDAMFIHP